MARPPSAFVPHEGAMAAEGGAYFHAGCEIARAGEPADFLAVCVLCIS